MLPAKRLNTLLEQSQEFQTDRCLRHSLKTGNGILPPALDPSFLCRDHKCGELKSLNTSYLTDSYIGFTLKMESVTKNTIIGLKMMVKSGLEKFILKSLQAGR